MTIEEFYISIGEDFSKALAILMDPKRVEKFVRMFKDEPTYNDLLVAFEKGDIETSFRLAHTLKGLVSSLGFMKLFQAASDLTEYLRPRNDMNCVNLLEAVKKEYAFVMEKLNEF